MNLTLDFWRPRASAQGLLITTTNIQVQYMANASVGLATIWSWIGVGWSQKYNADEASIIFLLLFRPKKRWQALWKWPPWKQKWWIEGESCVGEGEVRTGSMASEVKDMCKCQTARSHGSAKCKPRKGMGSYAICILNALMVVEHSVSTSMSLLLLYC